MNWRQTFDSVKAWWDAAGGDERYLIIVMVSGALSIAALLLDNSAPPRETFHRVRIEQ